MLKTKSRLFWRMLVMNSLPPPSLTTECPNASNTVAIAFHVSGESYSSRASSGQPGVEITDSLRSYARPIFISYSHRLKLTLCVGRYLSKRIFDRCCFAARFGIDFAFRVPVPYEAALIIP